MTEGLSPYAEEIDAAESRRLEADKAGAEARAERAALDIERCEIRAPFDGVVSSLSVEVGSKLRPGSEILRLVNLDLIDVPLEPAISTNPYFKFDAVVQESGTFQFTWYDDDGSVYDEAKKIKIG